LHCGNICKIEIDAIWLYNFEEMAPNFETEIFTCISGHITWKITYWSNSL